MVAHSMGGVVAEQACIQGIKDSQYQSLIRSTFAMIFLATPHHGSEVADLMDDAIRKMSLGFFLKPYVTELRSDSNVLNRIDKNFLSSLPGITIASFYETRGVPLTSRMVVKKSSATLGRAGEIIMPLNTDHHMICKYRSRCDGNYIAFLCVLRKMIVDATRKPLCGKYWTSGARVNLENDQEISKSLLDLVPGSCDWIFSDPTFSLWMYGEERKPRSLWLSGQSGSGKSILSAFIAKHIRMQPDCKLCYFSAPKASEASLSPNVLLGSFVRQLSAQIPGLDPVSTLLMGLNNDLDSSWIIFWRILASTFLSVGSKDRIYLIIDDIDKFRDAGSFLAAMDEHSAIGFPLRLLVASRISQYTWPSEMSQGSFKPQILNLRCHKGVEKDLRSFVAKRIEGLRGLEDLKSEIISYILRGSGGNFLCANLLYEEIKKCRRKDRLQSALNQAPLEGATSFYELIERDLASGLTTDDKDDLRDLMPWILYSFVPITIEQMQHGMKLLGVEFIDLKSTISRLCGRFVIINDKSQVRLFHPTVQSFILKQNSVLNVDSKSAHLSIFTSSLSCLNSLASAGPRQQRNLGLFHEYAMKFWFRHLDECEINHSASIMCLLLKFFSGQGVLEWIFLVCHSQELQYLTMAAFSINRFITQTKETMPTSKSIKLIEKCSFDLCMIVERFSRPLLSDPDVIFDLIPAYCPLESFIKPLARTSKITVDGLLFQEWDDYLAAFTIDHGCRGTGISCSTNHFVITTSTQEGLVLMYNYPKTGPACEFVHGERVMGCEFSRSGKRLVTYGPTTTTLWDLSTKKPHQTFNSTPNTTILASSFGQDDCTILTFSEDHVLRKLLLDGVTHDWTEVDLGARSKLANQWLNPSCATFDHQSRFLAIGFRGDPIEVWDLQSFSCTARLERSSCLQNDVIQLCWSSHPGQIIVREELGSLEIIDILRQESVATCADTVSTMACNATSDFIVTGDMAGTIKIRRISDLELLHHARGTEGNFVAISVAPINGKIYGIQNSQCTIWEPSLFAIMSSDKRSQDPTPLETPLPRQPKSGEDQSIITALATCANSYTYSTGYLNGQVNVILNGGAKFSLDLPTRVRIEHIAWSPDGKFLAIADLGARLFIVSLNPKTHEFNQLASFRFQSRVEQILFQRTSQALLVVMKDEMFIWELDSYCVKESRHSLGEFSRWINHPSGDELILGVGTDKINIYRWQDQISVSSISLDISLSDLTFGLELLDYVKTEPAGTTLHPSLAVRRVKEVLTSPETNTLLLVTTHHSSETISGSQFMKIPMARLNDNVDDGVFPTPLIESLSDVIAMPLGFFSCTRGQGMLKQVRGGSLIFLSKENWICSVWLGNDGEGPVRRHIFLPDDWLDAESVELVRVCRDRIYIPRAGQVVVIQNAFDAWY
ncbi:hypothetical protein N7481_004913 [Penicillium waksmanii]|uniref:uncharacterized protein n=1 Tax=Penicillium waksmanii TaxID=69791 RepID=UPI002547B1A0|nr:uncharacterized protein N7481_004913 [Penicillium waksmanii]KAJ5989703.1 hypothetical protein N7481_004913 [Penicillium waksmanii]